MSDTLDLTPTPDGYRQMLEVIRPCENDDRPYRPHDVAGFTCEDCDRQFCDECGNGRVCFPCGRKRTYCCEDCDGPR